MILLSLVYGFFGRIGLCGDGILFLSRDSFVWKRDFVFLAKRDTGDGMHGVSQFSRDRLIVPNRVQCGRCLHPRSEPHFNDGQRQARQRWKKRTGFEPAHENLRNMDRGFISISPGNKKYIYAAGWFGGGYSLQVLKYFRFHRELVRTRIFSDFATYQSIALEVSHWILLWAYSSYFMFLQQRCRCSFFVAE